MLGEQKVQQCHNCSPNIDGYHPCRKFWKLEVGSNSTSGAEELVVIISIHPLSVL
jgi:hypothetical protein